LLNIAFKLFPQSALIIPFTPMTDYRRIFSLSRLIKVAGVFAPKFAMQAVFVGVFSFPANLALICGRL